ACQYDKGDYESAIATFDRLLAEYPAGDKVPGAHLKKGFAFLEMNRTTQGVVQLQYLIEHYPASDEARVARERLKAMGPRTEEECPAAGTHGCCRRIGIPVRFVARRSNIPDILAPRSSRPGRRSGLVENMTSGARHQLTAPPAFPSMAAFPENRWP